MDASSAWRAYILHMVRMMMWDRKTEDQNFRDTMHDFVQTYYGKAATTEEEIRPFVDFIKRSTRSIVR